MLYALIIKCTIIGPLLFFFLVSIWPWSATCFVSNVSVVPSCCWYWYFYEIKSVFVTFSLCHRSTIKWLWWTRSIHRVYCRICCLEWYYTICMLKHVNFNRLTRYRRFDPYHISTPPIPLPSSFLLNRHHSLTLPLSYIRINRQQKQRTSNLEYFWLVDFFTIAHVWV